MCRDIQIEQDSIPENLERFSVITTADGAPDGRATILINDDDGKSHIFLMQIECLHDFCEPRQLPFFPVPVIGLEESVYSVNESDGVATVCAVLQPQGAVLGRDLTFSFVVQDGSASGKMITMFS